MRFYTIKRKWPYSTVFVLGNGPSLGLVKNFAEGFKKMHVIAVNSAFLIGDFVDVLFFGDAKWYWWNREEVQKFNGLKFTLNICRNKDKSLENEKKIHILKSGGLRGIHTDPQCLCWNRSSGGAAVNLAYHLGAGKIVLIGFDMRRINSKKNFFPNPQEDTKPDPYRRMSDYNIWSQVKKSADKLGIKIVNATPNSQLSVIKRVELEQILCSESKRNLKR